VNLSDRKIRTYMGTLLPKAGNINFAGTGEISPLLNDPTYQTIGFGTKIFLGGAQGRIVGEGTQHSPQTGFGTIAVKGELREMSPRYLKGAIIPEYGTSLLVGLGIPIPILNEELARSTAITNENIETNLLDYGIARSDRPTLKKVRYSELLSGKVELSGASIKTSPLSSFKLAYEIMDETAKWIDEKTFFFAECVERLPDQRIVKPLKMKTRIPLVFEVMTKEVFFATDNDSMEKVSKVMVEKGVDQIPIVNVEKKLLGIVTSIDFTKAIAEKKKKLTDVMTKRVITSKPTEAIDEVSRRLEKYGFNSTPVVDGNGKVIGIITVSDINRTYGRLTK
jgi:L-aspartate semialdehyde sulfurtransferase